MGKKDGMKTPIGRSIFSPDTNIRLGSAYLAELAQKSRRSPVLMAAAYNGGWGNVGGWVRAGKDKELDLWVEDIPFGQTRKYTKRVMTSFWIYSWLLEEAKIPVVDLKVVSRL